MQKKFDAAVAKIIETVMDQPGMSEWAKIQMVRNGATDEDLAVIEEGIESDANMALFSQFYDFEGQWCRKVLTGAISMLQSTDAAARKNEGAGAEANGGWARLDPEGSLETKVSQAIEHAQQGHEVTRERLLDYIKAHLLTGSISLDDFAHEFCGPDGLPL